jgi:hypothetical protein
MLDINIKKQSISQIKSFAVKTTNDQRKNISKALKYAREDTIKEATMEIESLFTEHEGRHPDAEKHGMEHFEFVPNQSFMGNQIVFGLEVRPADEVGIFLMGGTEPHVIEGRDWNLLSFEFTEGGRFIGPSTFHPGIEGRIDEMEEIVNEIFIKNINKYLGMA